MPAEPERTENLARPGAYASSAGERLAMTRSLKRRLIAANSVASSELEDRIIVAIQIESSAGANYRTTKKAEMLRQGT